MGDWSNKQWKRIAASSIPWAMIAPHEVQALKNHCKQSLERRAERGGLGADEAIAVLEDRQWAQMDVDESTAKLASMAAAWLKTKE